MLSKTITIKYLVPLGLAVAVGGGLVSLALAESNQSVSPSNQSASSKSSSSHPAMVLEVNSKGKILLRGTVESVASSSLVVKSWGGNWTVKISSDTKIYPKANATSTLSGFEKGDFVGVIGQVTETENFTVNAETVRNWTMKEKVKAGEQEGKKEAKEAKKEGAKLFVGVAGTVASSSLILTSQEKTYTVHLTSSTKILNKNWLKINLSQIQLGDKVRIYGTASSTDIQAEVVRDISLPK